MNILQSTQTVFFIVIPGSVKNKSHHKYVVIVPLDCRNVIVMSESDHFLFKPNRNGCRIYVDITTE